MDKRPLTAVRCNEETVREADPGVYLILNRVRGGFELRRIRFNRRKFNRHDAQTWWPNNEARITHEFRLVDRSSAPGSVRSGAGAGSSNGGGGTSNGDPAALGREPGVQMQSHPLAIGRQGSDGDLPCTPGGAPASGSDEPVASAQRQRNDGRQ